MEPVGDRPDHDTEPNRVQRAPDELRPQRQADRPTRRLLRGTGRGWRRTDHHRGALDTPDRLAVREADPRVPSRRDPGLPRDDRGGASPPRADLRPDQPQRWTGQLDVFAP